MGKRKRNALNKKELGEDFSVDIFVSVWEDLKKLDTIKLKFALYWILCNEKILELFVQKVLKLESSRFLKTLFLNGYHNCKNHIIQIFPPEIFIEIDDIFVHHDSRLKFTQPLKTCIFMFSNLDIRKLRVFQKQRENSCKTGKTYALIEVDIRRISSSKLKTLTGVILGDWDHTNKTSIPDPKFIFLKFPSDLVVVQEKKRFTYFFDRSGVKPY